MNRVTLRGNVGQAPDIRTTQAGDKIANLSIATNEKWKDRETGEKRERVEWHRVCIFGPLAGVVEQYVSKGDSLLVEGELRTRKWQDQEGKDRYSTEVVLSGPKASLEMLGSRAGGAGDSRAEAQASAYGGSGVGRSGDAGSSGTSTYQEPEGRAAPPQGGEAGLPLGEDQPLNDEIPF